MNLNELSAIDAPPNPGEPDAVAVLAAVSAWLLAPEGKLAQAAEDGGALLAAGALVRVCRLAATRFSPTPGRLREWCETTSGHITLTALWPIGQEHQRGLPLAAFKQDVEARQAFEEKRAAYRFAAEAMTHGLAVAGAPPEIQDGAAALADWLDNAPWRALAAWDAALSLNLHEQEVAA